MVRLFFKTRKLLELLSTGVWILHKLRILLKLHNVECKIKNVYMWDAQIINKIRQVKENAGLINIA